MSDRGKRCADPVASFPTMQAQTDAAMVATSDDAAALLTYPGGKNGAGIFQRLISLMPPHRVYVEAFLGSGAILRRKRPASSNIGIDVDADVIARHVAAEGGSKCAFIHGDAVEWMEARKWVGDELIYCDPPYLGSARSSAVRTIYRCEMMSGEQHERLLRILTTIPAMVMISGYPSDLYYARLAEWRRVEYQAMTRGGLKREVAWMNYPEPTELHDYRFLGRDFHDRCRIRRKIKRMAAKLAALPGLERQAVITAITQMQGGSSDVPF